MDLTGLNELSTFNEYSLSSPTRSSISLPVQPQPQQQQQQQQQTQQAGIQNAPPLPPRSSQINTYAQQTYGVTNPLQYSSYSNTLGPSLYHNYNPISSSIYSPYTQPSSVIANNNSFVRAAEESTRGAFQSIESVVQAFSAVSAMFESTYYAVFNSFRAVVGVADQFYRLKTHLSGIVSAFALFKFFKYIYRRFLRVLRIAASIVSNTSAAGQAEKDAWSIAHDLSDTEKFVKSGSARQTNWPLVMFLAVVFGGPWLIWKILSSINNKDDSLWMQGKIDHFIAVAEFDFDGVNNDEISFRRGQKIIIAPKEYQPRVRGWLLGTVDGKSQGIMPANYLKILGKKSGENVKTE